MNPEHILIGIILGLLVYYYFKYVKENFDTIQARFDGCKDMTMKNSNIFKTTTPDTVSIDECKSLAVQDTNGENIIFGLSDFKDNKATCHYNYDTTMPEPVSNSATTCTIFENNSYGTTDSIAMYTLISNNTTIQPTTPNTPAVSNTPNMSNIPVNTPTASNSEINATEKIETPTLEQTNSMNAQIKNADIKSLDNTNVRTMAPKYNSINTPLLSTNPTNVYNNTSSINHVMPLNTVDLMSNNATLDSYHGDAGESLVKQIGFKGVSNIYAPIITL